MHKQKALIIRQVISTNINLFTTNDDENFSDDSIIAIFLQDMMMIGYFHEFKPILNITQSEYFVLSDIKFDANLENYGSRVMNRSLVLLLDFYGERSDNVIELTDSFMHKLNNEYYHQEIRPIEWNKPLFNSIGKVTLESKDFESELICISFLKDGFKTQYTVSSNTGIPSLYGICDDIFSVSNTDPNIQDVPDSLDTDISVNIPDVINYINQKINNTDA